jgi:DNA-binding CsgD family transcriptional regulator
MGIIVGACNYLDYHKLLQKIPEKEIDGEAKRLMQELFAGLSVPSHFSHSIYLVDYVTSKYLYVDESCFSIFGYTASHWIDEGLNGYISRLHPLDFDILNSHIFPENLHFLQSLPLQRYADIIFSYNYRILNAHGNYINILQRSSYIPSLQMGLPRASMGACIDVTHFKNEQNIVQTIEEIKEYNGKFFTEIIFKRNYMVHERNEKTLTTREREILKLLADGLCSKQVAELCCVSINTIHNHRKNMLQKTNCKSSSELISYAVKRGLL